jgi:hypothetical protein
VELTERIRMTLMELPSAALVDRTVVVDTFLDLLSATGDPDERLRLERSLAALPRSVVVDRMTVADALLDVLSPEKPSPN